MKQVHNLTDSQLLKALKGNQTERNDALEYLYYAPGWRDWVLGFVAQNGGDRSGGEDLFQEAVILFDRNVRQGRFKGYSSAKTYFLGIAKQRWFNQQRTNHTMIEITPAMYDGEQESSENLYIRKENKEIINQVINELGEPCKELLKLYKLSFSNEEIARQLNMSSAELAKKYIYRCRKRFRAFVMANEHLKELLGIRV